jgi:hypothetical protein
MSSQFLDVDALPTSLRASPNEGRGTAIRPLSGGSILCRFDPHLVVSSRPNTFEAGGRAAWVLLSEDPEEPSEVCIDGRHGRLENPGLEEVLEIIDETEELVRPGCELRGC